MVVSQRWLDKIDKPGDFVNFGLTLYGPLKLPVVGILGPSCTAVARRTRAGAGGVAAAAALPGAPLRAGGGN